MAAKNYYQAVPAVPQSSMVDPSGVPTPPWYQFFISLWQRTGGASGSVSSILDGITTNVGALLYRGVTEWDGLNVGSQYKVLRSSGTAPEWDTLDGNSFNAQAANTLFSGPSTGPSAVPGFRALVSADLASVAGQIPGTAGSSSAASGNVGEYTSTNVPSGSAVSLVTATAKDIGSVTLSAGDWDVWGNVALTLGGGVTVSNVNAWVSSVSATDPGAPNAGAYISGSGLTVLPVGMLRVSLAGSAAISLSTLATFSGGTLSAYGFIGARRRR